MDLYEGSDIAGIFTLERVDFAGHLLRFDGIEPNVIADRLPEGPEQQQLWEEWTDAIGREFKILAVRDLEDCLHLEDMRIVRVTQARHDLAQAERSTGLTLVRASLVVAANLLREEVDEAYAAVIMDTFRSAAFTHVKAINARREFTTE